MAALFGVALAIGFSPVAAQEEAADPYVRESYWQISFADIEEWISTYNEYVVPVLTRMQEAGTINGFTAGQHNTGGKYNFRFVMIVPDWASIDAALTELNSGMAAAGAPDFSNLIQAHEDHIWRLTDIYQQEGAPANEYLYIAKFNVQPAQLGMWNAFYEDVWRPALMSATEAGTLNGFAVEEHVHGGAMNWQLLLLSPGWDSLDDAWATQFAAFAASGERFDEMARAFSSHEDDIWETITVETGN
jgi:hypothetical protein